MPRSPDLVIFVLSTTTDKTDYFTPCIFVRGNEVAYQHMCSLNKVSIEFAKLIIILWSCTMMPHAFQGDKWMIHYLLDTRDSSQEKLACNIIHFIFMLLGCTCTISCSDQLLILFREFREHMEFGGCG